MAISSRFCPSSLRTTRTAAVSKPSSRTAIHLMNSSTRPPTAQAARGVIPLPVLSDPLNRVDAFLRFLPDRRTEVAHCRSQIRMAHVVLNRLQIDAVAQKGGTVRPPQLVQRPTLAFVQLRVASLTFATVQASAFCVLPQGPQEMGVLGLSLVVPTIKRVLGCFFLHAFNVSRRSAAHGISRCSESFTRKSQNLFP